MTEVVLAILGTYRLARMVVYEDGPADLFYKFRGFIYQKFDQEHWIFRGFNCVLCLSFWIAVPLAALISDSVVQFILNWFGVAGGVAIANHYLEPK